MLPVFNRLSNPFVKRPSKRLGTRVVVGTALASGFIIAGLGIGQLNPSHAQQGNGNVEDELLNEVLDAPPPETLAAIREAPFSELFTLEIPDREPGYAIKDKDFNPRYKSVGLYTLWGDVPEFDILQVSVFYCFRNRALANAQLEKITLLDGDEELVTIDQKLVTTQAEDVEVTPERYETTTFFSDPFNSPYWGGGYYGGNRRSAFPTRVVESVYVPAENCSVGGSRFDLLPVRDEIAQLPNKNLNVRMLFSNGRIENWRLGGGTVEKMKSFPSLQ